MSSNIRTELTVESPGGCPIATVSSTQGGSIDDVSRSSASKETGDVYEEFTVEKSVSPQGDGFEQVFAFDSHDVYRFSREPNRNCICDFIEDYGCPVADVQAENGDLYVTFHAPDAETIRDIVSGLRDQFSDVSVRQMTSADETSEESLVFLDLSPLTERQEEVLRTAYEMGFFRYPKDANAGEVSDELGIAASTFREHLDAALGKVLGEVLE